jgi:hypothetical protein
MNHKRPILYYTLVALIPLLGLMPIKPFGYFKSDDNYNMTVSSSNIPGKESWCIILDGKINLDYVDENDSIKFKTYQDTIILNHYELPDNLFAAIKGEQILINGYVRNVLKIGDTDNYIAYYDVENWKLKKVIPSFKLWDTETKVFMGIVFILGLILLIVSIIKRKQYIKFGKPDE